MHQANIDSSGATEKLEKKNEKNQKEATWKPIPKATTNVTRGILHNKKIKTKK